MKTKIIMFAVVFVLLSGCGYIAESGKIKGYSYNTASDIAYDMEQKEKG